MSKKHGRVGRPGMVLIYKPRTRHHQHDFTAGIELGDTYRSDQGIDEAGANAGSHVPDWQDEVLGSAFQLRIVREGVLGLGHANWQVIETLE